MINNQWYAVANAKKIKKGRIYGLKRLGLDLALFRNEEGELGCVLDRCTHRGAQLSHGKLSGTCITCPFHALTFDREGKCVFIPANGKAFTGDLSRYNVKSYPVREKHDIVYVWYGDPQNTADELPYFDDHLDGSYAYSEIEDLWHAHYSRCIENQLDVVHVPIVHYNTIGRGNKTLVNGPKSVFENNTLKTSANNEVDEGQTPRPPEQCEISENLYLAFKYPNVWMNHISPKVKVFIYFAPVDEEHTILYIRFYTRLTGLKTVDSLIAFFGKFANRIIERQDKRVVITQTPKASSYRSQEKLLSGDGPIVLYRKIRSEMQKENASVREE
jgi:phenylpropionate dioxygenase-like ring-hydroxylating dioxygenase large terminal subunit